MNIFVVDLAKTTLVFTAIVALASGAYASTISSFSISTGAQGGTPCFMSGSGPGTASCHSSNGNNEGDAGATLTDNSLEIAVGGNFAGGGSAFASITHEDLYRVPVNGPVSGLLSLTCSEFGPTPTAHFSLGSTTVSPPVETTFTGASQGSGECGRNEIARMPPAFIVSLAAMDNIVELHTSIDGSISASSDINGSRLRSVNRQRFPGRKRKPDHRNTIAGAGDLRDVRVGFAGGPSGDASETQAFGEPRQIACNRDPKHSSHFGTGSPSLQIWVFDTSARAIYTMTSQTSHNFYCGKTAKKIKSRSQVN